MVLCFVILESVWIYKAYIFQVFLQINVCVWPKTPRYICLPPPPRHDKTNQSKISKTIHELETLSNESSYKFATFTYLKFLSVEQTRK